MTDTPHSQDSDLALQTAVAIDAMQRKLASLNNSDRQDRNHDWAMEALAAVHQFLFEIDSPSACNAPLVDILLALDGLKKGISSPMFERIKTDGRPPADQDTQIRKAAAALLVDFLIAKASVQGNTLREAAAIGLAVEIINSSLDWRQRGGIQVEDAQVREYRKQVRAEAMDCRKKTVASDLYRQPAVDPAACSKTCADSDGSKYLAMVLQI